MVEPYSLRRWLRLPGRVALVLALGALFYKKRRWDTILRLATGRDLQWTSLADFAAWCTTVKSIRSASTN
jgi:hypothetical protein